MRNNHPTQTHMQPPLALLVLLLMPLENADALELAAKQTETALQKLSDAAREER